MPINLDKRDLRILYELDKDCRQPASAIAKIIGRSPQYVKYRIERLRAEQIIQAISILTPLLPGMTENYCFIKLKGSGVIEEKLVVDFLFKIPETYRLYYCEGDYALLASFLIKDHAKLHEIKALVTSHFPNIDILFFNAAVSSDIYTKNYLLGVVETNHLSLETRERDQFTKSVVELLHQNPFISLLDLSRTLNVSYDKIKYLFKTSRPYTGTRLILSPQLVKKSIILLDVLKEFDKIRGHAASNSHVVQMDSIIGEYNCALYFECFATEEISRIIKEFLYTFKDAIRSHIKLDIINVYKYRMTIL